MHGLAEIPTHIFAEKSAQLRRSLRCVETSQGDTSNEAFTVPINQCPGERVSAIELRLAIGADDQCTFFAQLSQQMSEEPERAVIGPVQVVNIEEQSLFTGEMSKYLRDSVEEKQPFLVRLQRRTFRKGTETGFNLRRELRNLRGFLAEHGA